MSKALDTATLLATNPRTEHGSETQGYLLNAAMTSGPRGGRNARWRHLHMDLK